VKECPHCGGNLRRPRSSPDHRRLFGLIAAAHAQWPETHEFQPDSPEHLRAWLTCRAGYRDVTTVQLGDAADETARDLLVRGVEAALAAARAVAFVRVHGTGIAVFTAKSIAWSKLGQDEFHSVRGRIEEIIEAELGVTAEQLLEGADAA